MTAPTDQFVAIAQRSQEAVTTAVRTWADTLQGYTGPFAGARPALPDPHAVVDDVFDLAEKVLTEQRELVKTVLTAGAQAAETVGEQAARATESLTAHAVSATETTAGTIKQATRAGRNAAKR